MYITCKPYGCSGGCGADISADLYQSAGALDDIVLADADDYGLAGYPGGCVGGGSYPCSSAGSIVPAGEAAYHDCNAFGLGPSPIPLAAVNFPIQAYESGYCGCDALESGTLFPELVL
ncbi:MAG: spore coat associated protein CotJA [Christensenellaceae bacterium]|nr:spore coat associated protein CotJA [Christensenellaceae bacterium]